MADQNTGVNVDEQFLKDFIAKGGKAETPTGRAVSDDNLDQFLDEVADSTPASTTPKQQALHNKAKRQELADNSQEELNAQQREQERNRKLQEQERDRQLQSNFGTAGKAISMGANALTPVTEGGARLADRVSNLSTVGGVGLLLAVLVVLLFVVVTVNPDGDTRIKQLWYLFNGRASLQGRVTLAKQDNANTTAEQQGASQAGQALLQKLGVAGLGVAGSSVPGDIAGSLLGAGLGVFGDGGYDGGYRESTL
jgi:hypothetical protein